MKVNTSSKEKLLNDFFGPRCGDFEPECAGCVAWRAFDTMRAERDALLKRVAELEGAMRPCLAMLDALVAESGKSVEYGEEDAFRRGEWFDAEDVAAIAATRAALSGEAGE
jgi:hypothetical protein